MFNYLCLTHFSFWSFTKRKVLKYKKSNINEKEWKLWNKISQYENELNIKSQNENLKHKVPVWIQLNVAFMFCVFRLFFSPCVWAVISHDFTVQGKKHYSCTVYALFMYRSRTAHGSHNTIHTFKIYFVTVFSVFIFSKNKFNPNGPKESK